MSKAKKSSQKILVVTFDVTGFSKAEIDSLEIEAVVQGEESDGQGGKYYDGRTGWPDTPVLGSGVTKRGKSTLLSVKFDVTRLTKEQIDWLASGVVVQGEASDDHPDVRSSTTKVLEKNNHAR